MSALKYLVKHFPVALVLFIAAMLPGYAAPVSYEQYGAKGDGVADDMPAILKAHAHANRHGLPVKSKPDAIYHLGTKALTAIYPFGNCFGNMPAAEAAKLAKELGYQGIGSIYPNRLEDYKTACEAEGIKVFSIYVGGKVNADGFEADKDIPTAITLLKGTDALVELNVQRGQDPNDVQAVALVRYVADLAKAAGLKVVLYPHADFHVERLDHALKIARAADCDNVGIAFNLCHFLKVQPADDLAAVFAEAKTLLWSVSICGAEWSTTLIRPLDGCVEKAPRGSGVGQRNPFGIRRFG